MKIRKATIKDVPKLKKLSSILRKILNKCSPLSRLGPKSKPKKGKKDYNEKFISGKNKWCFVVEENNKMLGFILFNIKKREPHWKIKTVGYIDFIVVDEKARKKGVSKLLMDKAYEIFKKKGLPYVELSVQTKNVLAHNVWKKQGFKDFRVYMYKKI